MSDGAAAPERRALVTEREMLLQHDGDIDDLLLWRAELRGAFRLVKIALGTSILSAVTSILAVAQMISAPR